MAGGPNWLEESRFCREPHERVSAMLPLEQKAAVNVPGRRRRRSSRRGLPGTLHASGTSCKAALQSLFLGPALRGSGTRPVYRLHLCTLRAADARADVRRPREPRPAWHCVPGSRPRCADPGVQRGSFFNER